MKTFIFTDVITGEEFKITCEPYEIHNIELKNKKFYDWSTGRILIKNEK